MEGGDLESTCISVDLDSRRGDRAPSRSLDAATYYVDGTAERASNREGSGRCPISSGWRARQGVDRRGLVVQRPVPDW